ncbi:MAG TPA: hypothetical protein VMA30_14710 [Xanthobacteraceae bacterium]|nr:hypothetical protein [Xanthobacteraceae bacterium]
MSERALGFVEEWISENVTAADAAGDGAARAKALAGRCLADANAQGIPASEISDAIDDLPAFIAGAIEEASERKEHGSEFETDQEIEVLVNPDGFENAAEDAAEDDDEKQ